MVATKLYRIQNIDSGEVDYFSTLNQIKEWLSFNKIKAKWINVK